MSLWFLLLLLYEYSGRPAFRRGARLRFGKNVIGRFAEILSAVRKAGGMEIVRMHKNTKEYDVLHEKKRENLVVLRIRIVKTVKFAE